MLPTTERAYPAGIYTIMTHTLTKLNVHYNYIQYANTRTIWKQTSYYSYYTIPQASPQQVSND